MRVLRPLLLPSGPSAVKPNRAIGFGAKASNDDPARPRASDAIADVGLRRVARPLLKLPPTSGETIMR
jgi:hypothetical protein